MTSADPIVITGCGCVTFFHAGTITEVMTAASRSDFRTSAGAGSFRSIPDSFRAALQTSSQEVQQDKLSWITALAIEIARSEARLRSSDVATDRLGLVLGCALAGELGMIDFANEVRQQTPRFVSPLHFPQTVGNYAAGALARAYQIRGPNMTLACGAASGHDAITEACRLLDDGAADVILAGGADVLSPELAPALPQSTGRVSEGACLFVLERTSSALKRAAEPLATIQKSMTIPSLPAYGHLHFADRDKSVVSCAGRFVDGAVAIEQWMGNCLGALGAFALAGAIAACRKIPVPISSGSPSDISYEVRELSHQRSTVENNQAYVLVEGDSSCISCIALTVDSSASGGL